MKSKVSFPFANYANREQAESSLNDWPELSWAERADLCAYLVACQFSNAAIIDALKLKKQLVSHLVRIGRALLPDLKQWLHEGKLSLGHARALSRLSAANQEDAARSVFAKNLSVRSLESFVKDKNRCHLMGNNRRHFELLSDRVSEHVGYPVSIRPVGTDQQVSIEIKCQNNAGFEAVMARLQVPLDEFF